MPVSRKFFAAILGAMAIASLTLLVVASQVEHRYPFLQVEDEMGNALSILQFDVRPAAACESIGSTFSNAVLSSCPKCKVRSFACLAELDETQKKYLSPEPIFEPSVSIANGVIVFHASDRAVALTACNQAARLSSESGPQAPCFAPGSTRYLVRSARAGEFSGTTLEWILAGILAMACVALLFAAATSGRLVDWLLGLTRRQKQFLIVITDVVTLEVTLWLAFVLRFDSFQTPPQGALMLFAIAPVVAIPVFVRSGLYRAVIRFLGAQAMTSVAKAVVIYAVLLTAAVYLLPVDDVPRSVMVIHTVLALLLIGGTRALARAWLSQTRSSRANGSSRRNVVIYGAGSAGVQLANALAHSKELRPVAFLDDDARLHRTRMGSLEVFAPEELQGILDRHQVTEILLAIPSVSRHRRNQIIELLEQMPVQVRTMPALSDLAEGKLKIEDLRDVDIDDLLGRDPVAPDPRLLKANITGKVVMVTGAGGSIGSELCRQIAALQPKALVLFEQSEFALYSIDQDLRNMLQVSQHPRFEITPLLGSVTDIPRVERAIRATGVNTIYHAAAYKHVPMVEGNPCEGTFNNVLGTYRTALAAAKHGVETFVLISTDKAVRPTNTMGATKRFAELVVQAFAASACEGASRTRFSAVRFGNVLGSSGSVIPLFREQIRRGGPVTVTDPRIVRYFMTAAEAAQLVIQAGAIGDAGDVHVLDMGSPVKILELAHRMIRLSGLQLKDENHSDGDISIEYSGLRPGEKLYEELLIGEDSSPTVHPRILRATEKMLPLTTIEAMIDELQAPLASGDSGAIRRMLMQAVDEFHPQCGNEDFLLSRSAPAADGLNAA